MGRLPILIGGNGERRTLRLVAQYADMWNGYGDAETIRAKNDVIDRWCAELGRDPREIERTVWIERAEPDLMRSLVDAGADHLILGLRAPYDLREVERLVARARLVTSARGAKTGTKTLSSSVFVAFEAHLDWKADVDRIWFAVNDIRCDAQIGLLVELDDRDHVRNRHGGVERLIVDRVGEHRPATGDGLRS